MNIDSIKSTLPLQSPQGPSTGRVGERQPASEVQARQRRDTLELSSQAQQILDTQRTESLQKIQSQINSGYYNRPEVIRETAGRIAERLPREINL